MDMKESLLKAYISPYCKINTKDKETILYELGYIWGVCRQLKDDEYATVSDSLDVVKSIIDKY